MDESRYQHLADMALAKLEAMLEDVDAEDVDVERAGDVITLTFRDGKKCVVNTQRPTRQIWLAANARAWHFGYDEASSRWLDDKGQGVELLGRVAAIVKESAGVDVTPPA
ncbi:MAG: iron donor protein CyaY [Labilithrix sp.]|nr:iron donor protein CyaY [Labilithrix sp.]MBX3212130.1 iron donor protein CyaY [Labilithrix sp.]